MTSAPGQQGVPKPGSGKRVRGRLAALAASAGSRQRPTPRGEGEGRGSDFVSLGILGLPRFLTSTMRGPVTAAGVFGSELILSVGGARSGSVGVCPDPPLHIRPLSSFRGRAGGYFYPRKSSRHL